jgi:hypothetical protein
MMDFRSHVRALWAVRRLVSLLSLLVAAAFVLWAAASPVTVMATATLSIRQPAFEGGTTTEAFALQAQRYVLLSQTQALRRAAAAAVGDGIDEATIARQVSVTPSTTGLLEVVATGRTDDRPADQVLAVSTALIDAVTQEQDRSRDADIASLEARLADVAQRSARIEVVDTRSRATRDALDAQAQSLVTAVAERSNQPSGGLSALGDVQIQRSTRGLLQIGLVSAIVAALVVGELVVASFRLRRRLVPGSEVSTVEHLTGAPVVPRIYRTVDGDLSPDDAAHLFLTVVGLQGAPPPSLTFVSLTPSPRAVAIAQVVSTVAAELGTRTLLVDMDPGAPGGSTPGDGRSELPGATLRRLSIDLDPPVVGGSTNRRRSLRPLLEQGLVIAAAPPYDRVTDVLYVARELGSVVLLADARSVTPAAVHDAAELLRRAGAPPIATALFHVDRARTVIQRSTRSVAPAPVERAVR